MVPWHHGTALKCDDDLNLFFSFLQRNFLLPSFLYRHQKGKSEEKVNLFLKAVRKVMSTKNKKSCAEKATY